MRPTSNNNNNNNITPAEHCAPTQDRERGVVWEETIIFLQDDVKMVRLRVCVCVCVCVRICACVLGLIIDIHAHMHIQTCI
jgi:hypothetical protein